MRDDDQTLVKIFGEADEKRVDLLRMSMVEIARGFIGQNEIGIVAKSSCDRGGMSSSLDETRCTYRRI